MKSEAINVPRTNVVEGPLQIRNSEDAIAAAFDYFDRCHGEVNGNVTTKNNAVPNSDHLEQLCPIGDPEEAVESEAPLLYNCRNSGADCHVTSEGDDAPSFQHEEVPVENEHLENSAAGASVSDPLSLEAHNGKPSRQDLTPLKTKKLKVKMFFRKLVELLKNHWRAVDRALKSINIETPDTGLGNEGATRGAKDASKKLKRRSCKKRKRGKRSSSSANVPSLREPVVNDVYTNSDEATPRFGQEFCAIWNVDDRVSEEVTDRVREHENQVVNDDPGNAAIESARVSNEEAEQKSIDVVHPALNSDVGRFDVENAMLPNSAINGVDEENPTPIDEINVSGVDSVHAVAEPHSKEENPEDFTNYRPASSNGTLEIDPLDSQFFGARGWLPMEKEKQRERMRSKLGEVRMMIARVLKRGSKSKRDKEIDEGYQAKLRRTEPPGHWVAHPGRGLIWTVEGADENSRTTEVANEGN